MPRWVLAARVIAVVAPALALLPRQASACSPYFSPPQPTDPAQVGLDHSPPRISSVKISNVVRDYSDDPGDSCRGFTRFLMSVVAEDDRTPPGELRYRLQDLMGDDYWVYDEPVPYLINWVFIDPNEPVELAYRVFVLDAAGNQSEPFEVYHPERAADEAAGCDLAWPRRAAPASLAGFLLFALGLGARRRAR